MYLSTPLHRQDVTQGQFFKQSLTDLNSEFSFLIGCLTKAKEPNLSYYLPIAGERIIGFILFPRVFMLMEMQSTSSSILNCVAVSIFYLVTITPRAPPYVYVCISLCVYFCVFQYV